MWNVLICRLHFKYFFLIYMEGILAFLERAKFMKFMYTRFSLGRWHTQLGKFNTLRAAAVMSAYNVKLGSTYHQRRVICVELFTTHIYIPMTIFP
jgi:hypothetical protein